MIPLDKAVIARLQKADKTFEVLVDPDKAQRVRRGENLPTGDFVAAGEVFSDSKKGERASEADINKAFGTNRFEDVVRIIIQKGEIHLTTEQRRKMQEEKQKQLVNLIARQAVDPRTHTPHPPVRIEKALAEAKFHVDPFKSAEEQASDAIDAIKPIIPIKLETVRVAIKVQSNYSAQVSGVVREYKLLKDQWSDDGSYMALVELSAGAQDAFYSRLNKITHGSVESKITERL